MTVLLLTGCQLAREDAGSIVEEDRLIGVFITAEHLDLFDLEGYLNDNFSGGEIKTDGQYQSRQYATLKTKTLTNAETGERFVIQDYVFEDIEGISYFSARMPAFAGADSYYSSTSGDGISDVHQAFDKKDDGGTTTLEGTIYTAPTAYNQAYYLNPVYQSADGSVYLTAGTGISAPMGAEGAVMSQSMSSTTTVTENGETTSESLSITISFKVMSAPVKTVLLQMDVDNALISRTEYAADEMPKTFAPDSDTEYIIAETHKRGAEGELKILREIFGKDAESIEYFIVREDGICIKHPLRIEW